MTLSDLLSMIDLDIFKQHDTESLGDVVEIISEWVAVNKKDFTRTEIKKVSEYIHDLVLKG